MAFKDRVLIVDDVVVMRSLLKSVLVSFGCEDVSEAACGEDALALLGKADYSLVFLDINMPGISGMKTLEKIREFDQDIFIIMVSSHSSAENVKQAIQNGVNGFIVKPYTQNKVGEILEKYRRRAGATSVS